MEARKHSVEERGEGPEQHQQGGYRIYVVVWFWLLVFTLIEIGIVVLGVPKWALVSGLLVLAMMKAALIVAYFMHLRYERLSMIYTVVTPLLLGFVLFAALGPDAVHVFLSR
jgi:cytochrome c oxidase subunit 4